MRTIVIFAIVLIVLAAAGRHLAGIVAECVVPGEPAAAVPQAVDAPATATADPEEDTL